MHRTQLKKVTREAVILKAIRENRGLSFADVARLTGKSIAWISHLENGRVDVSENHLNILLALYGLTEKTFRMYVEGKAFVETKERKECIDAAIDLTDDQLRSLMPLVKMLKNCQ